MKREPIFNIPPVIIAVLAVLALVHVVRTYVLSEQQDVEFLLTFAFIPVRYDTSVMLGDALPGGGADIWTFVTYAFIHADWTHLGVNAIWLLPFGSAVARRFGTIRFLAFFAVTAAAGAALHLATHAGEQFPMIGASAAISGTMAAAMRFSFQRGGPLGIAGTGRRQCISRTGDSAAQCLVRRARCAFCRSLVRHQYPVRAGVASDHRQRSIGGLAGPHRRLSRRVVAVFLVRSQAANFRKSTILLQCRISRCGMRVCNSQNFVLTELPHRQDRSVSPAALCAWAGMYVCAHEPS